MNTQPIAMFRHYLIIASRTLLRNRFFAFLNIIGLALGLACCMLIMLWVIDEVSFDRFHQHYDRLYRVQINRTTTDGISTQETMPYPLKEALHQASPAIQRTVMMNWGEGNLLSYGQQHINKVGVCASEEFFNMFSFDLIQGHPDQALKDPHHIVLTQSTAQALFGQEDPMGKVILVDHATAVTVTGIVRDVPTQSSLTFDYVLPYSFYELTQPWVANTKDRWDSGSFLVYAELAPGASAEQAHASIKNLVNENLAGEHQTEVFLNPISNWHLRNRFENGKASGGLIEYVHLFSIIACFIVVIACINFMNLSTARSESRAREVGVRKSVGSGRRSLVVQFLGEAIVLTSVAFAVALVMVELALPLYNILIAKKLYLDYSDPRFWAILAVGIVVIGVFAGSYPAFYLSGFRPLRVLKGKIYIGSSGIMPRKILVTVQFIASMLLIIATTVVYRQTNHLKSRHTGYNRDQLLLVWTNTETEAHYAALKEDLLRLHAVTAMCKSNSPVTRVFASNTVEWPGKKTPDPVSFATISTEYDYTRTLGIRMLQGRDFAPEYPADTASIIINESAMKTMGLQQPLGEKITMWGKPWTIVGVMEDVVMQSPAQPVAPLVMIFNPSWSSTLSIRLHNGIPTDQALAEVEAVFKKHAPSFPLWYYFADADYNRKFANVQLVSNLAFAFMILALIITAIGLLGLAAYAATQRAREISIRKVLGASAGQVVQLITRDFSYLVGLAFLIASPLGWYMMSRYLDQYAYRTTLPLWAIPTAGAATWLLTLLIVGTLALRASQANHAEHLRSDA